MEGSLRIKTNDLRIRISLGAGGQTFLLDGSPLEARAILLRFTEIIKNLSVKNVIDSSAT